MGSQRVGHNWVTFTFHFFESSQCCCRPDYSCTLMTWCPLCLPEKCLLSCLSRIFSNESTLHIRWPKYQSFSFSISPYNEYSGLISFRIDWFVLLVVQGTLTVFSSTTVPKNQFFSTQPYLWSHSHILTWLLQKKSIALTIYRPLLAKWCLCFLIHCQVCHSFSSKELTSFNFMAAVSVHSTFGAQENKFYHCFHCFSIYLP